MMIKRTLTWLALCVTLVALNVHASLQDGRPYEVRYDAMGFIIDGQYRLLRGGSVQWFRIPPAAWRDRLEKFRAAGFNTIDLYVPWNVVEPRPGEFNFSQPDLGRFLDLARELGLWVYLRPGPYITNEMDGGGVPGWLMTQSTKKSVSADGKVNFRTQDPDFLNYVRRYFSRLNAFVRPWLASSGGPIILYGIENEYNWFATFHEIDKLFWHEGGPERGLLQKANPNAYFSALRDMIRADGIDVPIATCPGDGKASWTGNVEGVIPMPNIYAGLGGEYPEKIVTDLLNDMHSSAHDEVYLNMPSGTTETDRDPARIRRMLLAGLDGTFAFNAVGAIQSGYRNSLVLNANGSDTLQRVFDFSAIENILTGYVSPTVGYFHNVIDYGGPITPSGHLRDNFYEFHADNLFFDTVEPWLAPAGTARKIPLPASGALRLSNTALGTREGGKTAWLYVQDGSEGTRFISLINETETPQTLALNGLGVDGLSLPRYMPLTLAPASVQPGQFGSRQAAPHRIIPVNLPLPGTGTLRYTTQQLVWSERVGNTRYLVLAGAGETALDGLFGAQVLLQDAAVEVHEVNSQQLTFTTDGMTRAKLVLQTRTGKLDIRIVPLLEAGRVWPVHHDGGFTLVMGADYVSPDGEHLWQGERPLEQIDQPLYAQIVRASGTLPALPSKPVTRRTIPQPPSASGATHTWQGQPRPMEALGQWTGAGWYIAELDLNRWWGLPWWEPADLYIQHASDIVSLWVNGQYITTVAPVGTELDSDSANRHYRLPDIRPYLKPGRNQIALRTEIWGHGSFMWPRGTLMGTQARIPSLGFDSVKGLWGEARLGWHALDRWAFVPETTINAGIRIARAEGQFAPGERRVLAWSLPAYPAEPDTYQPVALRLEGRNLRGRVYLDGELVGRWLSDDGWLHRGFWGRGQRDMWMNTSPDEFPLTHEALNDGQPHTLRVVIEDASAPGQPGTLTAVRWVAGT